MVLHRIDCEPPKRVPQQKPKRVPAPPAPEPIEEPVEIKMRSGVVLPAELAAVAARIKRKAGL